MRRDSQPSRSGCSQATYAITPRGLGRGAQENRLQLSAPLKYLQTLRGAHSSCFQFLAPDALSASARPVHPEVAGDITVSICTKDTITPIRVN